MIEGKRLKSKETPMPEAGKPCQLIAENDSSWPRGDNSWWKATDGILRRLPLKGAVASIDLIDIDGIFYLEAQGTTPGKIA